MLIRSVTALSLGLLLALGIGCGGSEPAPQAASDVQPDLPPVPEPVEEPAVEAPVEAPTPVVPSPTEIVTAGGTFMFSFADSDVKAKTEEDCSKKSKGDEDKTAACVQKVADAGAKEGIRFEKDEEDNWWWVSFGEAAGKEQIFNKVKFTIGGEEGRTLTLKPEGKDLGKKPMRKLPEEVTLDVPDESTVVMTDPKKGKLVYKKA
jgi:hypothetical protein